MAGALRGTGLNSTTFEDDAGVELADRTEVGFDCPNSHHFDIEFAQGIELPTVWECPRCGKRAERSDGAEPEVAPEKPTRTHMDMLRERRSTKELEELLAEQLAKHREDA